MSKTPYLIKTPEDESVIVRKDFKTLCEPLYDSMKAVQTSIRAFFPDSGTIPESAVYGHSSNGSTVGWVVDGIKHKYNGLSLLPAIGIHGSNDGRNRTRYFNAMVISFEGSYIPTVWGWSYGLKRTTHFTYEKEADTFAVDFQLWWKAYNVEMYYKYLNMKVKDLYEIMAETPSSNEYQQERCVYRHKDYQPWFKKKLNESQTVLSAFKIAAKSAHMMTTRRQLDVLHRANRLIDDRAWGRDVFRHNPVGWHNHLQTLRNAKQVMKAVMS